MLLFIEHYTQAFRYGCVFIRYYYCSAMDTMANHSHCASGSFSLFLHDCLSIEFVISMVWLAYRSVNEALPELAFVTKCQVMVNNAKNKWFVLVICVCTPVSFAPPTYLTGKLYLCRSKSTQPIELAPFDIWLEDTTPMHFESVWVSAFSIQLLRQFMSYILHT